MDSQDAKAIGCNRILQLSKEKTEFFFASRSRSAVTTAGCSIFLVFCTLTIFKKLGGGTQMWIFMKKAQQRSSFSWSRREVYMMIWLWYDVCIYIYILQYILHYISHDVSIILTIKHRCRFGGDGHVHCRGFDPVARGIALGPSLNEKYTSERLFRKNLRVLINESVWIVWCWRYFDLMIWLIIYIYRLYL